MQQTARQQGPWALSEQAIMNAKRRSHNGSSMTGHNSACMWTISLPNFKKLGHMYRKANISTLGQFTGCDQLRDTLHGTTSVRQICCKAQLVQQFSAQPSKVGMMSHMHWQHAERKAGLPCEGYLWWHDSVQNCQVLGSRQTSLGQCPSKGRHMTPSWLDMLAEELSNQPDSTK